jgi:HK97 family phage prohead protease
VIVRKGAGDFAVYTGEGVLAFLRGELGAGSDEYGVRSVAGNVELVCSVPFCLSADTGEGQGKAVSATPEGVAWTFSTFDLDRFSERIDPAGWDYKRYMDNPVVEWAHRYDIPAIGRADGLYADEKGLHGLVVFNDKDYDPFGWGIGERVKAGVIRAGSVGFRILEIEIPSKEAGKDGTTLIFRKQELLEFSICNVPANPWALTKPLALNKSEGLGMRSEGINPDFWGNFIGGING